MRRNMDFGLSATLDLYKMKLYSTEKIFLSIILFFFLSVTAFSQATTVNFTQQTGSFTTWGDGGGSWNQSATQMGVWANVAPSKQSVVWRTFKTADNNGGSARALKVGDKFTLSISATRAYGQIGFALLSSPSTGSWVNRESNYSLTVKLDGPAYTGNGTWGNWYATGAGTSAASFGGNQGTYKDFVFTVTLTAPDRANISITDGTSISNFYDFQLKNSNVITDFSVFLQDNWDGGANNNMYVGIGSGSNCSVQSTGALAIGGSSGTFSIGGVITNGVYADQTVTSYTNTLTKSGSGEVTLSAANTYSGTTTISGGTLTLGIANAIPANAMGLSGTLKTGATAGYGTTIGALTLNGTSTIALGSGSHTLTFSDSHLLTWTGTLSVTGWTGSATTSGGGTAGVIKFGSANTTLSSTQLSNITFSGFPSGAVLKSNGELVPASEASFNTAAAGDWNSGATWTGGSVPPAGAVTILNHAVTVNSSVTNAPSAITVSSGSSLTLGASGAITVSTLTNNGSVSMTSGGVLTIAAAGTFTNNLTFTGGIGTVNFAGAGTVNGSAVTTFNNLTINSGVLTLSMVPHIAGTFQIYNGNVSTAPIYDANSTLKYGVGYNRFNEWTAIGVGTTGVTAGYPYNVLVAAGKFDLSNGDVTNARACAGSLTVNSSDTLTMSSMPVALTVGGDITINGNLTLSPVTGGDIKSNGNINFGASSTFNSNNRAIFFIKDGTQTLSHASGAITIPYIVIGKLGGTGTTIQMSSTDITSSAPLGGNSISFTNSNDVLDLNGRNLTIGTSGQASTISGSGTIKGNSASSISILGTGAFGTVNFTTGSQTINNLTVNRTLTGTATLGTNLTVNGTLTMTSGNLDLNGKTVTLGTSATLVETAGSSVMGTSGTITTTRTFNAGNLSAGVNIAGLGAKITTTAALGSTVISRGHAAQTGNSNTGIKRYYDITPTTNTGLAATLEFNFDAANDLNGKTAANLVLFKSTNGGLSWSNAGGTYATNKVTLSGISDFSRWTLGESTAPLNSLTYISTASGTWETGSNWDQGSTPPSGATVIIAHDISYNSIGSISALVVKSGKTFSIASGKTLTASTVSDTGIVDLSAGGTLSVASSGTVTSTAAGTLTLGTGSISYAGAGTLTNNGTLTAGTGHVSFAGAGTLNNGGTYTAGSVGVTFSTTGSISNTGTFNAGSGSLTFTKAGTLSNSGTFNANTSTVTFDSAGTVTGTISLNNVNIANGVDFGTAGTVTGTLSINAGGYINTNPPIYSGTSTLKYNNGASYGRWLEWSATSGKGYPNNVQVSSNSTVDLGNAGTGTVRQIAGNLTIDAGSSFSMNVSQMTAGFTVNGNILNNGTLILSTLGGGDLNVKGNITNNSTFSCNGRLLQLNGATAQTISGTSAMTIDSLAVNNSAGIVLSQSASVNSALTLTSGTISLGSNNLTLGSSAVVSGTASATAMVITNGSGTMIKSLANAQTLPFSFTFPIGENTGTTEYSPVTITVTSGTLSSASLTAKVVNAKHASMNVSPSSYISRYWTLTSTGITTPSLGVTGTYRTADVTGTESSMVTGQRSGSSWTQLSAVNSSLHQISGTGLSSLGDFTAGSSDAFSSSGLVTVTFIPEGYYRSDVDPLPVTDVFTATLASTTAPDYAEVETVNVTLDSASYTGTATFTTAASGSYYLIIKGMAIMATWSASPIAFTKGGTVSYDFTTGLDKAFAIPGFPFDPMIQQGTKWCLYSGDVDQDELIGNVDLTMIDNDAFVTLEVHGATDLDGDALVGNVDLTICDNHAFWVVESQSPRKMGGMASKYLHKPVLKSAKQTQKQF